MWSQAQCDWYSGGDDISSENVRLRQPLEDVNGMIGPAGRSYEVDILVDNSTLLVFEVKSTCDVEDVDRFADKVALMRTLHPEQKVEGGNRHYGTAQSGRSAVC